MRASSSTVWSRNIVKWRANESRNFGYRRAEITRITDYIAAENPGTALGIAAQLRKHMNEIKERLYANALLAGFEHRQIRRKVHGNYLIIYRISDRYIEIVHVLHGAMDYQTIVGNDD